MINIQKAVSSISKEGGVRLQKTASKVIASNEKAASSVTNLNFMPHYKIQPNNIFRTLQKTLDDFKKDFGPVKSSTYLSEKIKQAKRQGLDEDAINELQKLKQEYLSNIKKMRKHMRQNVGNSLDEHVLNLNEYLSQNGSYMNCNECADIILSKLRKQGVQAENVLMYCKNKEGNRTSFMEHVFTVANLDKNCDISNAASWNKDAIICDGWAGVCMTKEKGIEYLKEFFGVNPNEHNVAFEILKNSYY